MDVWTVLKEGSNPRSDSLKNLRDLLSDQLPLGSSVGEMREFIDLHIRNPKANTSGPSAFSHYRVKLICSADRVTLIDPSKSCLTLVFGFESERLTEVNIALDGFKGVIRTFPILNAEIAEQDERAKMAGGAS